MYIKMLETRRVCDDGYHVLQLHAGDIYELRHSTGTFIVRSGWGYEVAGEASKPTHSSILENLAQANIDFDRIFRPQPTRGCAPTNPATLAAKGEVV